MTDPPATAVLPGSDSQEVTASSRPKTAELREADLLQKLLLTVPEAAFLLRVGARTVWRLMADPDSGFPRPRRIGGRTLLARDGVIAFVAKGDAR